MQYQVQEHISCVELKSTLGLRKKKLTNIKKTAIEIKFKILPTDGARKLVRIVVNWTL